MSSVQIKSIFRIPMMDYPLEERLVRMAVGEEPVRQMEFDLPARTVTMVHKTAPTGFSLS